MSEFASLSLVRQNYDDETEKGVNKQINLELQAFYTYLSLVSHLEEEEIFNLVYCLIL